MDIKSLPNNVRSLLRSCVNINNVSDCVRELVYNSLDAKSTAVAVRIDLQNFRIQVVDNGAGISKFDLGFVGVRYMTSKCQSLHDLKHRKKCYGFRGESLASIANVSEKLTITSKLIDTDCTYSKVIENKQISEVVQVRERPEHGTTVTVENFLYNVPVRQACIRSEQNVEDVKKDLELLVVIHPKVSFSLRNDVSLKIVLKVSKSASVLDAFINLHPEIIIDYMSICEVSKGNIFISGLIYRKSQTNKHLQLIYVNKRPITSSKIYKQIRTLYKEVCKNNELFQSNDYPVYVLNVSCPYSEINLIYSCSKTTVEFKNWEIISKSIAKLFCNEWGIKMKESKQDFFKGRKVADVASSAGISISNMLDVMKTKSLKRNFDSALQLKTKKRKVEKRQFALADVFVQKQRNSELASSNMNMRIFSCNAQQKAGSDEDLFSENDVKVNQSCDLENELKGKSLIMNYFLQSAEGCAEDDYSASGSSGLCVERIESNFCTKKQEHDATTTYSFKVTTEKKVKKKADDTKYNDAAFSTVISNNIAKKKRAELLNKVPVYKYNRGSNDNEARKRSLLNKCVQTSFCEDFMFADAKKDVACKCVQTDNSVVKTSFYYPPEEQESTANVSRYFCNEARNNIESCPSSNVKCSAREDLTFPFRQSPPEMLQRKNKTKLKADNIFTRPFTASIRSNTNFFGSLYGNSNAERKPFDNLFIEDVSHFHKKSKESEPVFSFKKSENCCLNKVAFGLSRKTKSADSIFDFGGTPIDLPVHKQSFEELFKTKQKTGLLGGNVSFLLNKNCNEEMKGKNASASQQVTATGNANESIEIKSDQKPVEGTLKSTGTEPLLFSLNERDKMFLLESDLKAEERLYKHKNEATQESEFTRTNSFSNNHCKNWIKQKSIFGPSAYFNVITGTSVFNVPEKENTFNFKERFDFLPKGCSPITSAFAKVTKILSPNSKEYLEKTILKSFLDEVQIVKWQNYLNSNSDWATFLSELYKEKARAFEKSIPKAPTINSKLGTSISKRIFDDLQILSQVDKKFIAVLEQKNKQLFFFDQHAVHERIRVEMLFKEYREDNQYQGVPRYRSLHCEHTIFIVLDDLDVEVVKAHTAAFGGVGLDFKISESTAEITKIPECFLNKAKRTHSSASRKTLECLVKTLMSEVIETLKFTKGCLTTTPNIITEVINSEACRGAIKFGESLTYEEMKFCLNSLRQCSLPFQCAHGRPTLTPIISLQEQVQRISKPNFTNLRKDF